MQMSQFDFLEKILNKFKEIDTIWRSLPLIGRHIDPLAALGFLLLLILMALFLVKRKRKEKTVLQNEPPPEKIAEPVEPSVEVKEIDEDGIVDFFLNIYKVQLGGTPQTKGHFKLLDTGAANTRRTYELTVLRDKQRASRRMSVGLLGEDSASRSQCFTVIFDNHYVIKAPRNPITNFEHFITAIESDRKIVKKLAPRECIVPTVSAVLKMIHPFSEGEQLTPERLEEKYLDWLRKFPAFQAHLKTGGAFIFVMDLSRYFFLSHIINDLYDLPNKMYQEIVGYPDVIWENHGFEGRYATENDEQLDAIRKVYTAFEEGSQPLLNKTARHSLPRYTLQRWFLVHLAGRLLEAGEKDLPAERIAEVNALLEKTFAEHKDAIDTYRRTIRGCIQSLTVSQNTHQIAGLVTNLLDLLAWLRSRGVAMRDLKPDNLFIAGDKARYPEYLDTIDSYSVGLIDVETAVAYGAEDGPQVPQPILGGTPTYATPSHLMPNEALEACFKGAGRILYLQDWYAAVGIIYEIITGERLFDQTGKLIIGIKTLIFKNVGDVAVQTEIFKNASRMFWHSAQTEMAKKAGDKKVILQRVAVGLTENIRVFLREELQREKRCIAKSLVETIDGQGVFKNEKTGRNLRAASRKKITQVKVRWREAHPDGKEGLRVLNDIESLKHAAEKNRQLITLIETPQATVAAYDLLFFMFGVVQKAMYRETWGDLVPAAVVGVPEAKGVTTIAATI
ncbi:MAG: hypothetical protein WAM73_06555 [Desulfobacterales bacterium]